MSWMFLLVVFMALGAFAVVIGVMVVLFRAASKSSARPSEGANAVPPILTDDSLTNAANPLYHLHHPSVSTHNPSGHHSADSGPSHSAFDSTPSSSPSFDSGNSSGASFDSGSSSSSSDSGGSGCG